MAGELKDLLERVHTPGAMRDWRHSAEVKRRMEGGDTHKTIGTFSDMTRRYVFELLDGSESLTGDEAGKIARAVEKVMEAELKKAYKASGLL